MIINIDEELKLSKFRKIIKLISKSSRIIKISIDGQLYDISRIMDKNDMIIFEVDEFDEAAENSGDE